MSEVPQLNIRPCFVCGEITHCDGEDGGGCYCACPGCEFCRKHYGLEDWWASLAWRDPDRLGAASDKVDLFAVGGGVKGEGRRR